MCEPIFKRETMRQRGIDAHAAGRPRDDHNMNPWAPALPDWLEGWDHAALLKAYHAPAERAQVELAQVA